MKISRRVALATPLATPAVGGAGGSALVKDMRYQGMGEVCDRDKGPVEEDKDSLEEAVTAYDVAKRTLQGPMAKTNF